RRMMRFENLAAHEQTTRAITEKLVQLRRSSLPLVYGDFNWVQIEDQLLIYQRKYFGDTVFICFNKSGEPKQVELKEASTNATAQFGSKLQFENQRTTLTLKPHSFEIITSTSTASK
ncbi:MAG: hypothetical protein HOP30_06325, partial [Cyclobacteriaceae bacterium]|nr:hypothetical protein [Cyclobacteriaceae bacterium]